MLFEYCGDSRYDEIANIRIAVELLQRMMAELQFEKANYPRLAAAMATSGHDLRQRLHLLLGTIDSMTAANDPSHADDLHRRVKSSIYELAQELEVLAVHLDQNSIH
jgi:hypothetical protein